MKTSLQRGFGVVVFVLLLNLAASAENNSIALPTPPPSPTSMDECDRLQSEWDSLRQQINAEHESCLAAHSSEQSNPNSGSGPGSICSHSECQSFHDDLFTIIGPQSQASVQECRDAVNQYQQQQAQQQAATQQAEQLAQQQLQQQVEYFRSEGQRLADLARQRQAAHQAAIQRAQAQQVAEQTAHDQLESHLQTEAQERVNELKSEEDQGQDRPNADAASMTTQPEVPPVVTQLSADTTPLTDQASPAQTSEQISASPSGETSDGQASVFPEQPPSILDSAKREIDRDLTPETQELLTDMAKDQAESYVKDQVRNSGVEGEILVGAVETEEKFLPAVSDFLQQAGNFVDVLRGNTTSEQTANTMFESLKQVGGLMLKDTVAGALFVNGSEGIWKANNLAMGKLDQELSMFNGDIPYDEQKADQLTDFSDVGRAAVFGICGMCEKLYNAQQIAVGEWNLLVQRFGGE